MKRGEFNLESLHAETDWLVDAVHELAKRYELHEEAMIMMGFSNGANIGAHAMMAVKIPHGRPRCSSTRCLLNDWKRFKI